MPREESKCAEPVNPIQARLEARERERAAKKPLTSKDLENKMADAEERRKMELEAIKYKGQLGSKPAPHARSTAEEGKECESKCDDRDERYSHK